MYEFPSQDLFASGLPMVPHGCPEISYKKILLGDFSEVARHRLALPNIEECDDDGGSDGFAPIVPICDAAGSSSARHAPPALAPPIIGGAAEHLAEQGGEEDPEEHDRDWVDALEDALVSSDDVDEEWHCGDAAAAAEAAAAAVEIVEIAAALEVAGAAAVAAAVPDESADVPMPTCTAVTIAAEGAGTCAAASSSAATSAAAAAAPVSDLPAAPSAAAAPESNHAALEALEFELKRGAWGAFTISVKKVEKGRPYGGYQASCIYHKLNDKTGCKKFWRNHGPTKADALMTLRALVFWCQEAKEHSRQRNHMWFDPKPDDESLPSWAFMKGRRLEATHRSREVKTDVELDEACVPENVMPPRSWQLCDEIQAAAAAAKARKKPKAKGAMPKAAAAMAAPSAKAGPSPGSNSGRSGSRGSRRSSRGGSGSSSSSSSSSSTPSFMKEPV